MVNMEGPLPESPQFPGPYNPPKIFPPPVILGNLPTRRGPGGGSRVLQTTGNEHHVLSCHRSSGRWTRCFLRPQAGLSLVKVNRIIGPYAGAILEVGETKALPDRSGNPGHPARSQASPLSLSGPLPEQSRYSLPSNLIYEGFFLW